MLWFEQGWLLLLIDVSVKSLALALVAWGVLAMLRVTNANIRHRVWSAVLLAQLTLPLLVPVTPTIPMPNWLLPEFVTAQTEPLDDRATDPVTQFVSGESQTPELPSADFSSSYGDREPPDSTAASLSTDHSTASPDFHADQPATPASLSFDLAASKDPSNRHWFTVAFGIYASVAALFLLRIFTGLWGTSRIVSRSIPCEIGSTTHSDTPSALVGQPSVGFYESADLRVPLTIGFFHPKILLPANWRDWPQTKLASVIAHETAHIQRGDYLVALLAELNLALHWFNPLSWCLRHWLSDLAEQNCDDAVISLTGERTLYARHLLEVAASLQDKKQRVAWTGVAMARKPRVESRIDAILDSNRPLSQRLGLAGATLLTALAVAAILFAAAVHPVEAMPEQLANESTSTTTEEDTPKDSATLATDASALQVAADSTDSPAVRSSATPDRIHGQIVDKQGVGIKATVYVISTWSGGLMGQGREEVLTSFATDDEGNFDVPYQLPNRDDSIELGDMPGTRVEKLVATADGFGPAVSDIIAARKGEVVKLALPKDDVPIEGRILTLEGEPVAKAQLRIAILRQPKDLDKTLTNLRQRAGEEPKGVMLGTFKPFTAFEADTRYLNERIAGNKLSYSSLAPGAVTTDNDGRFRIDGIGRDQLLALELSGPGIVSGWISVVTRDIEPIGKTMYIGNRTDATYGARFTFSAEPAQFIKGRVTDKDSGEPIQGISISPSSAMAGIGSATTDQNGDYTLTGLPKTDHHDLDFSAPPNLPYLSRRYVRVKDLAEGLQPITLDFQLKRTSWISGTVTNKLTGQPIKARVFFTSHIENALATEYALQPAHIDPIRMTLGADTDTDGQFRVKAVPGEGILVAMCKDKGFRTALGADQLGQHWLTPERVGHPAELKTFDRLLPGWTHCLKVATATLEKQVSEDLIVDPGNTLDVHLVDASNQPLTGVHVRNRFPFSWNSEHPLDEAAVRLLAIHPDQPRTILFYHREKNLGAFLLADQAERTGQRTVKLEPCGVVKGRLVSADGNPITNVGIGIKPVALTTTSYEAVIPYGETDENGNFTIERFTPSARFKMVTMYTAEQEVITKSIEIKPSEIRDLGEITLGKNQSRAKLNNFGSVDAGDTNDESAAGPTGSMDTSQLDMAKKRNGAEASRPPRSSTESVYSGTLTLANGEPARGAFVAVIATKLHGDSWEHAQLLAESTSNAQGHYEIRLQGISDETHAAPFLIARSDDSGIVWKKLVFGAPRTVLGNMTLRHQQVIQARFVDLEGKPASNLEIKLGAIMIPSDKAQADFVGHFRNLDRVPRAWLPPLETNDDGLLSINNISKGHGIFLHIVASDKFAPQRIALNTGMAEERTETDATYRSVVRNFPTGEVATIPLSPAKIFEGVVMLGDSGEPAANARISMWASQQEFGSMASIESMTDAKGRFRLNPKPGIRFGIKAHPPEGTPYQVQRLDGLRWSSGEESKNIKIVLQRGVLATGTVVDAETGEPLQDAAIQYYPKQTNPNRNDNIVTGWQGIKKTNEQGKFAIPVIAGEGTLFVHAADRRYILQERGSRQVSLNKPGGRRWYAHAFVDINPSRDGPSVPVRIELTRGESATVKVVDRENKPVKEALIISRLKISSLSPYWRGFPDEMSGGLAEIQGLEPGDDYPIQFIS